METQKHYPRQGKSLLAYAGEFILLFLAVFGALFLFKKLNDRPDLKGEKTQVSSLVDGLNADISLIERNIRIRNDQFNQLDSLQLLITEKKIYGYENDLYYFGKNAARDVTFRSESRVERMLGNSKGITLINSRSVLDSIYSYTGGYEYVSEQTNESESRKAMFPFLARIYNPVEFEKMTGSEGQVVKPKNNPYLRSTDSELLTDFSFYLHDYKSKIRMNTNRLRRLQVRAKQLIEFLQLQYQLK